MHSGRKSRNRVLEWGSRMIAHCLHLNFLWMKLIRRFDLCWRSFDVCFLNIDLASFFFFSSFLVHNPRAVVAAIHLGGGYALYDKMVVDA